MLDTARRPRLPPDPSPPGLFWAGTDLLLSRGHGPSGFGPQRSSCSSCESCKASEEQCCGKFTGLYDPFFGGYATTITVDAKFAFAIPAGIPLDRCGPLLCAGVTTYAPLSRNVKRGDKVGIVGIGGLGHMALQYAKAMGAHVVAISTSASKEAEAKSFGAAELLVSTDAAAMKAAASSFDFILCCASGNFKVATYTALLKPRKSFCLVGLPAVDQPLVFEPFHIVGGERQIIGSMIGGTAAMKEMLAFSAEHKCFPMCEVIPFAKAQEGEGARAPHGAPARTRARQTNLPPPLLHRLRQDHRGLGALPHGPRHGRRARRRAPRGRRGGVARARQVERV